eukprot:344388-Prorocentrum_minimum.AAC.1
MCGSSPTRHGEDHEDDCHLRQHGVGGRVRQRRDVRQLARELARAGGGIDPTPPGDHAAREEDHARVARQSA